MAPRRGDYGIDSPYVPAGLAAAALAGFAAAAIFAAFSLYWLAGASLAVGATFALSTLSFLWTTRRGKFIVWNELLDSLALSGNERLLDVGCGRGAVLLLAAQRLPRGSAVGVDLWSTADQSGNSARVTWRNAELEGVRERIGLHTADMRRLPFADASFDVVTSSLAVHNIADVPEREHALAEMLRVLKPNGTIMLADILHTGAYDRYFSSQPNTRVERRRLGWRFWYGGPHAATTLIKVRYSA